jgi:hypothetical protein
MLIDVSAVFKLFSCSSLSRTASTTFPALVNSQRNAAAADSHAPPSEDTSTRLQDVVSYCSIHLGLQGLACLAVSSKQMHKVCLHTASSDAALLLVHAVDAAASEEQHAADAPLCKKKKNKHAQAAAWLLRAAPQAATTATAAQQLVRLPRVPLHVAKQFVQAGLSISYAQMQAAANSMVAGVEMWMEAQHQLGITADVPTTVVALCCRNVRAAPGPETG